MKGFAVPIRDNGAGQDELKKDKLLYPVFSELSDHMLKHKLSLAEGKVIVLHRINSTVLYLKFVPHRTIALMMRMIITILLITSCCRLHQQSSYWVATFIQYKHPEQTCRQLSTWHIFN